MRGSCREVKEAVTTSTLDQNGSGSEALLVTEDLEDCREEICHEDCDLSIEDENLEDCREETCHED